MLMIVGGVITAVMLVVSIAIAAILCFKKKSVDAADYMSDMKNSEIMKVTGGPSLSHHQHQYHHPHHHHHSGVDSGSSGADSDVKLEIRTSCSSLTEQQHAWLEGCTATDRSVTANEISQVVENIYNYSQQQQQDPLYSSTNKIVSIYCSDPEKLADTQHTTNLYRE